MTCSAVHYTGSLPDIKMLESLKKKKNPPVNIPNPLMDNPVWEKTNNEDLIM